MEGSMEGLQRILVGVDFSDYSLPTLRYALALAHDTDAEVVVVNVINDRDVGAVRAAQQFTDVITVDSYIKEQKAERLKKIEDLIEETACGEVRVSTVFRVGVPGAELLRAIKETKADLVVIGAKGRSNLSNVLFGSAAEKLHRRSPVSVLSVRGEEHAKLACKLLETE